MKKNEEFLQRCLDGDLNDEEMRDLFLEMGRNEELRMQFRSFQILRNELRSLPSQDVSATLDELIRSLRPVSKFSIRTDRFSISQMFSKKFTLSIPAFAATVLLLLAGSYFATTKIFAGKTETEIVYIMQLPQIEVHAIIN